MLKVLVVDDSIVFRTGIKEALEPEKEIEVVGTAIHGEHCLEQMKALNPDVITLDLEMPKLDGLQTIQEIRKINDKVKIIVFSAHSEVGADKTFQALSYGAQDFLPKSIVDTEEDSVLGIRKVLVPKILQFRTRSLDVEDTKQRPSDMIGKIRSFNPKCLCIGSSTGGPEALKNFFTGVTEKLGVPIFVVQHMPAMFTKQLASLLDSISPMTVKEAEHGEEVKVDTVYIAPGDYHMKVKKAGDLLIIHLNQEEKVKSVRPAVDVLFKSIKESYNSSAVAMIMTGMGDDGLDGVRALKPAGCPVLIQNEESCVVFGMPGAIYENKLHDAAFDINGLVECVNWKWR